MELNTINIVTKPCLVCGKTTTLMLDIESVRRWQRGELTQRAFPDMSKHERELLISGTHPDCWTQLFPEEE